jgi:hypothetical protein
MFFAPIYPLIDDADIVAGYGVDVLAVYLYGLLIAQ